MRARYGDDVDDDVVVVVVDDVDVDVVVDVVVDGCFAVANTASDTRGDFTLASAGTQCSWTASYEATLRAALWDATGSCAGLDAAGPEAWCACERCNGREPAACEGVPGGLKGLLESISSDSVCAL